MDSARVFYRIFPNQPGAGIFKVIAAFPPSRESHFSLQFAYWRPGRYMQGNFLKNLRDIAFYVPGENAPIPPDQIQRTDALGWTINVESSSGLEVHYSMMAHELNAGSSYCDPDFIQINPVNLCLASLHQLHIPHAYQMENVEHLSMANPLSQTGTGFQTADFDHLADAPAWWAKHLMTEPFHVNGYEFFLHHTSKAPDFSEKVIPALRTIIQTQLSGFKNYEPNPFHFMVLATVQPSHHGVEHTHSTICQLGPDDLLLSEKWDELLRLLSHEFYHVWNIKYIRPNAYLPYPLFSQKISPETLWAEGVTTYMGDKILSLAGLWSPEEWIQKINIWWIRHLESPGNTFASLFTSAEETWIDGYEAERIFRRRSIYNEGALLCFWLDVRLIQDSNGQACLQTLMRRLHEKSLQESGYTITDILQEIRAMGFDNLAENAKEAFHFIGYYDAYIQEALSILGLESTWCESAGTWSKSLGVVTFPNGRIAHVRENSPAMQLGIMPGDEWEKRPDAALEITDVPEELTFIRQGRQIQVQWPKVNRQPWTFPQWTIPHLGSHPVFKTWMLAHAGISRHS